MNKLFPILVSLASAALLFQCKTSEGQLTGKFFARPDISSDGVRIVFIYADKREDAWEVYSADITGRGVKQLTFFPEAKIKKGPVWSPDGSRIAFHADINDGSQIFVMDSDGRDLTQITDAPGYNCEPYWSADGRKIIYNQSIPSEGLTRMLIMNADGSDVQSLPNPDGQNWYPRITPQDEIIFTSDVHESDFYDIFIMSPDSSNIRQLTSTKAINWFPEYSPDGRQIAFHSNRDDPELSPSGNYNLYLMHADGTNLKRITDLPGQQTHAKWHPSGEKLIFEWYLEGYGSKGLHLVDLETGEVRKISFNR